MPAFNLLESSQIEALISYVTHLSIRGNVEYDIFSKFFKYKETPAEQVDPEADILEEMQSAYNRILKNWEKSQTKAIKLKPYPYAGKGADELKASIRRGYLNFIGKKTDETPKADGIKCISCHKNF